uniref:Uncharacterized protein n=1 Tax=Lepeophtheirus salmonis TaxID=72036 RepID=A0A0K2TDX7_LEPSM
MRYYKSCFTKSDNLYSAYIRKTTEAEESQGGDPALHLNSRGTRLKNNEHLLKEELETAIRLVNFV